MWLQLTELHPLNSSSSQFQRVRVTEVVDKLMTERFKSRHRTNPSQGSKDVLVKILTTEVQGKLGFQYSESGGIGIAEIQKAIAKWCELQSNVCNISNTRLALSTPRSE